METKYQKKEYTICLGGSTISGKTTYISTYINKYFTEIKNTTSGVSMSCIQAQEGIDKKFVIFDTCRWEERFRSINQIYLSTSDVVILLFDLSYRNDFNELKLCLDIISDYYELEDFPVLLIGNKADLKKEVTYEEIKEFQVKENLIGYFEVSCKELLNVDKSLNFMINYIYEKEKKFPMNDENDF